MRVWLEKRWKAIFEELAKQPHFLQQLQIRLQKAAEKKFERNMFVGTYSKELER